MRDPGRRGKRRDLRRALHSGGFSAHSYYARKHSGLPRHWMGYIAHLNGESTCGCPNHHVCSNLEEDWVCKHTGVQHWDSFGMGNAPAHFRRYLNRAQRTLEKAALRKAFLDEDWDGFALPRYRRNVNWMWW